MAQLLKIEDLTCSYDNEDIITGLSLGLNEGDIGCLLGPSGCGKSTILRAIAGFHPVSKGSISLQGSVISSSNTNIAPEKRPVGMVFQDYALFPHMTLAQNVGYGLHKLPTNKRKAKVAEMLDLVNLSDLSNRYPHELSGGQQQRVSLARAMAPEPSLILLDEPFSNLDVELRKRLSLDIRDILKSLNMTAILVTHDQHEAFAMCDQIGVIKDGIIQQWDSPYNLYHEPINRFVASFVGQGCFLKGTLVSHEKFETELGLIEGNRAYNWKTGSHVDILIRPDDIVFDPSSSLTCQIISKTFAGTSTLYRVQLKSGAIIEGLFPSHQDLYIGDQINISLAVDHLIAFQWSEPSSKVTQ